mmetsp:Transcript_926/g.3564  ORF Transcript_926/g.3564 Transcript_926/m.3564 type:complete len:276 (+) Transcript_926:730-1557(+)
MCKITPRITSDHHLTSVSAQSTNVPVCSCVFSPIILSNCDAARSAEKRFSGGTFFLNGSLNAVSTVPGCSRINVTGNFFRANSIAQFTVSWFSADFDARYECQPPSLLSPRDETRALRLATMACLPVFFVSPSPLPSSLPAKLNFVPFVSRSAKCLATKVGPMALTRYAFIMACSSSRAMLVSGAMENDPDFTWSTAAVWQSTSTRPNFFFTNSAAAAMVSVFSTSSFTTDKRVGCFFNNSVSANEPAGSRHVATTCPFAAFGRPGNPASGISRS